MNSLAHVVPRLIIGVAIVHIAFGLAFETPLGDIADAGVVDGIGTDPERESSLWFALTGLAWLGLGELARWTVRETGRIPARLGGWILGTGVLLTLLMPASGGWLVIAIGLLALRAAAAPEPLAARA
jgi:hypothetical protein